LKGLHRENVHPVRRFRRRFLRRFAIDQRSAAGSRPAKPLGANPVSATTIEWADHTANPIRAFSTTPGGHVPRTPRRGHYCEKISPGCANCYASTLQRRFQMPGFPGVTRDSETVRLDGVTKTGVRPYLDEAVLAAIRKRRKPTRYFIGDMTDVFGSWVPDEWLDAMFATFANSPQHTFMLLTKRADRMRSYCTPRPEWDFGPLPNVWLGVSAENNKQWQTRTPNLEKTPAAVRFVSVEPMLEPIKLYAVGAMDWVIFGGESGHGARPCNVEWIRDGLAQCKAAGVPAFVKQLGARAIEPSAETSSGTQPSACLHPKGGDPSEWPEDLRVREFPETTR
jgi:protein gp37